MARVLIFTFLVVLTFNVQAQRRPIPTENSRNSVPHDPTGSGRWNGKVSHTKLKTIFGLRNPESVLIAKNSIFISEMGEDTGSILKDGNVSRYSLNGVLDRNFSIKEQLISPMGMALIGNSLYLADQYRVVAISSLSGDIEWELDLSSEGATFLNDAEVVNDKYLLVTATNLKRIFCIDLQTKDLVDLEIDLNGAAPNGIKYDSNNSVLYIAANKEHKLGRYGNGVVLSYDLNLDLKTTTLITKSYIGKFIDGISIDKDKILISDWFSRKADGRIYTLSSSTLEYINETIFQTSGLADFDYDPSLRLLVSPNLINGKVQLYRKSY